MGYALISVKDKKITLLTLGMLELSKFEDHYVRLQKIFSRTLQLIDDFNPTEMAVEAPFYGKNAQVLLKLGRAQGAAISAALFRNLPIFEYAPRKIKMSITGSGASSKEQVAAMLVEMLKLRKDSFDSATTLDATDALGAAVCHVYQKISNKKTSFNSWKDFIRQNPNRIDNFSPQN